MSKESDEKRELLKLKQGLIEQSDIIEEDVHEEIVKPTGFKWIENFMYRNKWYFLAAVFAISLLGFMTYQLLSKESADLTVIVAISDSAKTPNIYQKVNDLELAFEQYCPDFDGNGKVHVDVYHIDLTKNSNMQYVQVNTAKFYGEIERGQAELYICDPDILSTVGSSVDYDPESTVITYDMMFADIGEATGLEEYKGIKRVSVRDTAFATDAKWENSCPETLAFSIREEKEGMVSYNASKESQIRAKEVLRNILTGNKVNETQTESSSD